MKDDNPGLKKHQGRSFKGDHSREIIQGRPLFVQDRVILYDLTHSFSKHLEFFYIVSRKNSYVLRHTKYSYTKTG